MKSGLSAQLGLVDEVTYGTPVTVTRFLPIVSENILRKIGRIESKGIYAGRRVIDSTQWAPGNVDVAGGIQLELTDRALGLLFKHMFGGAAISGAGPYTQTYTPGAIDGKSLTVQVGRPDTGTGTVRPHTFVGGKVTKWALACKVGEIATLGLDMVFRDEYVGRTVTDGAITSGSPNLTSASASFSTDDIGRPVSGPAGIPAATTIVSVTSATVAVMSANATATASAQTVNIAPPLAAVSYPSGMVPLVFTGGAFTLGGSAVPVADVTLTGDNKLDTGRRFLGSGLISEPLEADDRREYLGEFTPEFTDLTLYNRFVNGATGAMVLAFAAGANTLTITTNVRYDDVANNVNGMGRLNAPTKVKLLGATDAAAITLVTVNSDAAA